MVPYVMFASHATHCNEFHAICINLWTTIDPIHSIKQISETDVHNSYAHELREKLHATQQVTKENLKIEKITAKENYNKKVMQITFKVGDKVLLHDETTSMIKETQFAMDTTVQHNRKISRRLNNEEKH